ncbi:MAG TPA: isochorismatase family protein [Chloroflexota bacterium]
MDSPTPRVWEPFLTPQDRAHLAIARDRRVGYGKAPALLLIDLYRWVFGNEPRPLLEAVKTWPGSCGLAAWNALPYLQDLLGMARELGLPVVHITGLEDSGMLGWGEAAHGGAGRGPSTPQQRRGRYDIIPEVAPIAGEVVLRKTAPSAFNGTPLLAQLNYLGVDTLIVGGESTSGCVRASVVDGCSYRFKVIVVEECVFDRHQAAHAMNLFDMHQKYADVLRLSEVEAHLRAASTQETPRHPSARIAAADSSGFAVATSPSTVVSARD